MEKMAPITKLLRGSYEMNIFHRYLHGGLPQWRGQSPEEHHYQDVNSARYDPFGLIDEHEKEAEQMSEWTFSYQRKK
jgi:hypothetical protein